MRLFATLFLIVSYNEAKKQKFGQSRQLTEQSKPRQEYIAKMFDATEDRWKNPVPFGHIFKEGFEDPRSGYMRPIDLLEFDTAYMQDGPAAREFIKNNPSNYKILNNPPKPPKPYVYQHKDTNEADVERVNEVSSKSNMKNITDNIRSYWDFEAILTRNIHEPPKFRLGGGQTPPQKQAEEGPSIDETPDLYPMSYAMEDKPKVYNFTSCDEFGKRAKFHPNDIVDLDWVPFYIWTYDIQGKVAVSRIHHFSYPTKKFIIEFRNKYGPFLNKSVDWQQPKLVLKFGLTEMLLIAVDRSGLFISISYLNLPVDMKDFPVNLVIPATIMRLKIVDPYLAMMYCDEQYAVIMAISGTEPTSPRMCTSEAAALKLRGKGFPVRRDFHMEVMEIRAKQEAIAKKEEDKIFDLTDDMNAAKETFTP